MLRGLPLTTTAKVAVMRSSANPRAVLRVLERNSSGSDTIHVSGRRDGSDPVALTLDIYLQEDQQKPQVESIASPALSRKCSWAALKKLRASLQLAVDGSHCGQCAQLAVFLEHCFERPAIFDRSWNGEMVLSTTRVAHFVNKTLRFAHAMSQSEARSECHELVAALLSAFLAPGDKKTE